MDARKSLEQLRDEWEQCTACNLGERRFAPDQGPREQRNFIFGEGVRRGIMIVGEAPRRVEEWEGRPFGVGSDKTFTPGKLVLKTLTKLGIINHVYLTNTVACRSCSMVMGDDGVTPKLRVPYGGKIPLPMYKDEPPLPHQMKACQPRLNEEIYLVDPIVIVALGQKPAERLLGRPVSILKEHGVVEHASIPGASFIPSLTEKKKEWGRKFQGSFHYPVVQNEVRYLVVPTLHPEFVLRHIADEKQTGPFAQFAADLRLAKNIFDTYMFETRGILPEEEEEESPLKFQESIIDGEEFDDDDADYEST